MNKKNNDNLEMMEEMIGSFVKPDISSVREEKIKENLFQSLESMKVENQFNKGFSEVRNAVNIENQKRAILKEKLITDFEKKHRSKTWNWKFAFSFPLAVLVLVFSFSFFGNFGDDNSGSQDPDLIAEHNSEEMVDNAAPPIVDDSSLVVEKNLSFIASFEGDVYLQRGNEELEIVNGLEIFERDQLIVHDGFLELEFFDGTQMRLENGSELRVDDLFDQDQMRFIGLNLASGDVHVSNKTQANDQVSPFFLNVGDYSFVSDLSSFDLSYDGTSNLEVEGEKVMIISENGLDVSSGLLAFEVGDYQFDANLGELDFDFQNYDNDSQLLAQAFDYLDFSQLEIQKVNFDLAELYFQKNRGTSDRVVALNEFIEQTDDLYKLIDEIRSYDREYAEILKDQVDQTMVAYSEDVEDFFSSYILSENPDFDAEVLVEGEIDPQFFEDFINIDLSF